MAKVSQSWVQQNRLVRKQINWVRSIVRWEFVPNLPPGVDIEDLVGAGLEGWVQALNKFNSSLGVPFNKFAKFRIHGAIIDSLRKKDFVSRLVRKRVQTVEKIIHSILLREGTLEELSQISGLSTEQVEEAQWARKLEFCPLSFPVFITEEKSVWLADRLAGSQELDPEFCLCKQENFQRLWQQVDRLPHSEKLVIQKHYRDGLFQEEIAKTLGVTLSRVSQIHHKAIIRLRKRISKERCYNDK